jgi:hypothetical protein
VSNPPPEPRSAPPQPVPPLPSQVVPLQRAARTGSNTPRWRAAPAVPERHPLTRRPIEARAAPTPAG